MPDRVIRRWHVRIVDVLTFDKAIMCNRCPLTENLQYDGCLLDNVPGPVLDAARLAHTVVEVDRTYAIPRIKPK